ncbi:MAG TPA: lysophospholipid acyltransferase family protein [Marmoricola sp.]
MSAPAAPVTGGRDGAPRVGPRVGRRHRAGAALRRLLWRASFRVGAGGLEVTGPVPTDACVLVANHSSHADTAALLAALPAAAAPVVAAAADHWFASRRRALVCRLLTGGRPVRRGGGGWADLRSLDRHLRQGRIVVVFPEGTRSRDGSLGRFHSGAFRLAEHTGVPVVPVALTGTAQVLPRDGSPRQRACCRVAFGDPLDPGTIAAPEIARVRVLGLLAGGDDGPR